MNQTLIQDPIQQTDILLPPRMQTALEQYRQRVWMIKLAEAALAALFGLSLSYLLVFGLDRLFDTPSLLRVLILVAGSVGTVILFPLKYHYWVWRHRRFDQVARLLRGKFPRFGDQLLGVVELAHIQSPQYSSRPMYTSVPLIAAAMHQVDTELEKYDLSEAVPHPKHRLWAVLAAIPLLLIVTLNILLPAAGSNTLARWLMPWQNIERYTFAQLAGQAEARVVAYAEPFSLGAELKEDSPRKPDTGQAQFGKQLPIVAERDNLTYQFNIPPQTVEGGILVKVGDARRSIPISPKMRPALTDLTADVQLPAYLQLPAPRLQDARGGSLNLVRGSAAVFKARATRNLSEATLNGKIQAVNGPEITTEALNVTTGTDYQLSWIDQFGLTALQPQTLRLQAVDDEAPTVNFNKLKNNQVILSNQVLAFGIQAGDDFGVKRIGLEWESIVDPVQNPEPSTGEKIVAAGGPDQQQMSATATFSAAKEKVRPQSLRLRAFVEDYLPQRQPVYSPDVVLHVLTPAEHFTWLAEQMALWVNAAQEVYDKELQLNQANRELSNLPSEALDDPAVRQKIQQQAAAETANAAMLESLIELGTELVQEATKNEEFDPNQLEAWAEILQQLKEISAEQMPSVADLLAQAVEAPGTPTETVETLPQSDPTEPTEPGQGQQEAEGGPPAPIGGEDRGLEKADKYGPDSKKPPEGLAETPEDPNNPAGDVNVDRSELPDGKPGYLPANPTPLVLDFESGFNESEPAGQPPQVLGGMGIPVTVLKGSGQENEDGDPPSAQTAELVLQAVQEQQELLDAFAELAGDMNQLLLGFENSTFVKRLKAASRRQIDIAAEISNLNGFGLPDNEVENQVQRVKLGEQQVAESGTIFTLLEDMVAYADRKPSVNYSRVLYEMLAANLKRQIRAISEDINQNLVGQSTIESEFWADTLDRWAEQLVDPLPPPPPPGEMQLIILPNLPPKIIVEVLRIIDRQILLREETRELEQAQQAIEAEDYQAQADELKATQQHLHQQTKILVKQIDELPNAQEQLIQRQLNKLINASEVMVEVEEILAQPDTGVKAIAAESEVIEILLETARIPNAPMVIKVPPTSTSALLLMGMGDDSSQAFIQNRAPKQASGKSGRVLPEEFRPGLDAYFDALEGKSIE